MAKAINYDKHVHEGWTVKAIVEELEPLADMIMRGEAIQKPFKNTNELKKWVADNTPYYKKADADVVKHFAQRYSLDKDKSIER